MFLHIDQPKFQPGLKSVSLFLSAGSERLPGHHQTAAVSTFHRETENNTPACVEASILLVLTLSGDHIWKHLFIL